MRKIINANQEEKINAVLNEIIKANRRIHKPIVRGLEARIRENETEIIKDSKIQRSI